MSLTSTPFFAVLIVATVVMMVGAIALWPKVRGPRAVRWLVHAVMIGLCQLTAIGVVATWINNSYGLYASWDDLLGNANTNAVAMPGPPVHRAKFSKSTKGGVLDTYFHGRRSALLPARAGRSRAENACPTAMTASRPPLEALVQPCSW